MSEQTNDRCQCGAPLMDHICPGGNGAVYRDYEAKHVGFTPGPWSVTRGIIRSIHHHPDITHESTMLARVETRRNADEADANARLISAAPDLLKERDALRPLCEEMLAALQGLREPYGSDSFRANVERYRKADRAIERAEAALKGGE